MGHPAFSGVMTAIATPFTTSGSIDQAAFKKLLQLQKQAGIHGVVVAGTTGESPTLSEEERDLLVTLALEESTDSFHVYVGTGTNDTRTTVAASRKYASFKSPNGKTPQGVMVVTPYYNKPTQRGLVEHFTAVSEGLPRGAALCVYNVPGRTACTLAVASFLTLVGKCSNIVAIKEAAGDVRVITELKNGLTALNVGRRVEILSGDDPTFAPALLCGASGVISVSSHIIPGAMLDMLKAAQTGALERLQAIHLAAYPVNTELFCAPNPVPLKWALAHLAVCQGTLRGPLAAFTEAEGVPVKNAIDAVKAAGLKILA